MKSSVNKRNLVANIKLYEIVILLLIAVSLITSCIIISNKKFFWNDELYSYYLLSDPSFSSMLAAFHDKINGTPILYFALGWIWSKVFDSTELSLRLFSSFGICLAHFYVWLTLRRTYSFWATTISTLAVFCTSNLILTQNAEARMYGLFVLMIALGVYQYDYSNRAKELTRKFYISNILVHAAIVHTHLFGFFYSAAIVFSQIVADIMRKKIRPRLYLSIALGILSIIFYIPSFLIQSDVGNPRSWLPIPTLRDLIEFVSVPTPSFFRASFLIAVLILGGYFSIFANSIESQKNSEINNGQNQQKSLLLVAYSFLMIPVAVWVASRLIKPIFWDRYVIPSSIGWCIILAHLISLFFPQFKEAGNRFVSTQKNILLSVLALLLLVQPITFAMQLPEPTYPGSQDNRYGYVELPIAAQLSWQFLERRYYSPERNRYFFVLDWETAIDDRSGLFGSQEYKHLEAIKRNYPESFADSILESDAFLERFDRFLVLDYPDYDRVCSPVVYGLDRAKMWDGIHCPQWFEQRLMNNPQYQVTPLGEKDGEYLLLVEKQF